MNIKNSPAKDYFFTKHEKLQLSNNYDIDLNNVEILHRKSGYTQYMQETKTTFVKRSKYDCYEDNSMLITNCINEFYAKQLHCNLPWTTKIDPDFKQCETAEELKQFRKLSVDITLPNNTEKINEMGCFKPNCLQTTWTKKKNEEKWDQYYTNKTTLYLILTAMSKLIRRHEIRLADYSTFLADCGGYLGLFLGASLLSITDAIISYSCQCLRSARNFCLKFNPYISPLK